MIIEIPDYVNTVLASLEGAGFLGYVVGGCVRDSLMYKTPEDWDVTTNASPEEMKRVFDGMRVIETGIQHGTLTVISEKHSVEVTSFRIDGSYSDRRRPDFVRFSNNLADDLSRRDFTVNALAFSPRTGLIDQFGGMDDIKNRIIRCVRNPDLRFGEDALRILRALRFSSVLNFDIEPHTASGIQKNKELLNSVAIERIAKELLKLLCGQNVQRVLLGFSDVVFEIVPELCGLSLWQEKARFIEFCPALPAPRFAALLFGLQEKEAFDCLTRLRLPKQLIRKACLLLRHYETELFDEQKFLRLLGEIGVENFFLLLDFIAAGAAAFNDEHRAASVANARKIAKSSLLREDCLTLSDLKINGADLLAAGIPAGKQIGETLEYLLSKALAKEIANERSELLKAALTR